MTLNFTHRCTLCKYHTERRYNFERHMKNKHEHANVESIVEAEDTQVEVSTTSTERFPCQTCYKVYNNRKMLNKHIPYCKKISSPLECDMCHKIFTQSGNLSKHKKYVCKKNTNTQQIDTTPPKETSDISYAVTDVEAVRIHVTNNIHITIDSKETDPNRYMNVEDAHKLFIMGYCFGFELQQHKYQHKIESHIPLHT